MAAGTGVQLGAPPSYLDDAVAAIELARYQEGPSSVVVSRDGDELRFSSSYDDYGRTITEETRIAKADFIAKGEGPWPWYDLGDKREGVIVRALVGQRRRALFGYRSKEVADVIDILRAGGAAVTDRHRELAARSGASQVEAALRG